MLAGAGEEGGGEKKAAGAPRALQPHWQSSWLCTAGRQPRLRNHLRLSVFLLWGWPTAKGMPVLAYRIHKLNTFWSGCDNP